MLSKTKLIWIGIASVVVGLFLVKKFIEPVIPPTPPSDQALKDDAKKAEEELTARLAAEAEAKKAEAEKQAAEDVEKAKQQASEEKKKLIEEAKKDPGKFDKKIEDKLGLKKSKKSYKAKE
jgi:regulator of protease activity HflC (stomatin/prohibitin superfamily)